MNSDCFSLLYCYSVKCIYTVNINCLDIENTNHLYCVMHRTELLNWTELLGTEYYSLYTELLFFYIFRVEVIYYTYAKVSSTKW